MPRILVVEDNEDNRDSLSRRLERRGFEVLIATDGKRGVAMAAAEKPDLILMDMNMPEMDGWEATRKIKAAPEAGDVPVIALTAHAMTGDRERALAVGFDGYIAKPYRLRELVACVEDFLGPGVEPEGGDDGWEIGGPP